MEERLRAGDLSLRVWLPDGCREARGTAEIGDESARSAASGSAEGSEMILAHSVRFRVITMH